MQDRTVTALFSTIVFGTFVGLALWMTSGDLGLSLIAGMVIGILFTGSMRIFSSVTERLLRRRDPGGWAAEEKIIRSEPANMMRLGEGAGGMLYLTNIRLRFHAHRFNIDVDDYSFSLASVQSTKSFRIWGVIPTGLKIQFADGRTVNFVVHNRNDWVTAIEQQTKLQPVLPSDHNPKGLGFREQTKES